ncbi:MAG: hypothetical protein IKP86_02690, partial [Anaerolineaceae bacterium]|nr:hypothetical protein [Anaerolineaceae bacterium]
DRFIVIAADGSTMIPERSVTEEKAGLEHKKEPGVKENSIVNHHDDSVPGHDRLQCVPLKVAGLPDKVVGG